MLASHALAVALKALTICEPYATLILRGLKPVENRTWETPYRGPMYLHAGKSRQWLTLDPGKTMDVSYKIPLSEMHFGAVIGIVHLIDCVHISKMPVQYPSLATHEHTNGPWCWVLDQKRITPIGPWPWKGALGLFEIDDDALGRVANQQLGIPEP